MQETHALTEEEIIEEIREKLRQVELNDEHFGGFIELTTNYILGNQSDAVVEASLESLGLILQRNQFLPQHIPGAARKPYFIISAALESKLNADSTQMYTVAFQAINRSLGFLHEYFRDNEKEYDFTVWTVCGAIMRGEPSVKITGFQCLTKLLTTIFTNTPCLDQLVKVTLHSIESEDDRIRLEGINLWTSVWQNEFKYITNIDLLNSFCQHYIRGALPRLLPPLAKLIIPRNKCSEEIESAVYKCMSIVSKLNDEIIRNIQDKNSSEEIVCQAFDILGLICKHTSAKKGEMTIISKIIEENMNSKSLQIRMASIKCLKRSINSTLDDLDEAVKHKIVMLIHCAKDENLTIVSLAFQCLKKIALLHYRKMRDHLHEALEVTIKVMGCSTPSTSLAAILFLSSVCRIERFGRIDTEDLFPFTLVNNLVSILLGILETQQSVIIDEDRLHPATLECLHLLSSVSPNGMHQISDGLMVCIDDLSDQRRKVLLDATQFIARDVN